MKRLLIVIMLFVMSITYSQTHSLIIGDSQVRYIAMNSNKAEALIRLTQPGIGLKKLNEKVKGYEVSKTVQNVFVCIGVNDNYKYEEVGFMKNLKRVFPNAKIYMIKGSYGWGNTKKFNPNYYDNFKTHVLKNGIGKGDPHKNKNSYKLIGKEIDSIIN